MKEIKFINVDEDYIKYLCKFDDVVRKPKKGKERPYVGVLFKIGDYDYFAPLSSPEVDTDGEPTEKYKRKFKVDNRPTFERIDNLKYGTINISNMIPIKATQIIDIDIDSIADEKYRKLLKEQFIYCDNNKQKIFKKAATLYDLVTVKKVNFYVKLSCDFKTLERKCDEY